MDSQPRRHRARTSLPTAGLILGGLALAGCLVVLPGCAQDSSTEGQGVTGASGSAVQAPVPAGSAATPHSGALQSQPLKVKAEELRKKFPFESLARRLEYERDGVARLAREDNEVQLTDAAEQRLKKFEKTFSDINRWDVRARSLALLHSDQVEEFIARDGMGVSRMVPSPAPSFLELPDAPAIALPEVGSALEEELTGKPVPLAQKGPQRRAPANGLPSLDLLALFHDGGQFNFLNPGGFGYIVNRDRVAGFRPHQFRGMPELREPPVRGQKPAQPKDRWAVRRLELVSLLKHDEPAVYVSEYLPRMDALQKAVTRPLTDFESQAVKTLREGEDLVARATTEQIRMVGSLRAGKRCLSCHEVKRGELLGAFSYKLQRSPVKPAGK